MPITALGRARVRRRQTIFVNALIRKCQRIMREAGAKELEEEGGGGKGAKDLDIIAGEFADVTRELKELRDKLEQMTDPKNKKRRRDPEARSEEVRVRHEFNLAKGKANALLKTMDSHPSVRPVLDKKFEMQAKVTACGGDEKKRRKFEKKMEKYADRFREAEAWQERVEGLRKALEQLTELTGEKMTEMQGAGRLKELKDQVDGNRQTVDGWLGGAKAEKAHLDHAGDAFGAAAGEAAGSPGGEEMGPVQSQEEVQQIQQFEQEFQAQQAEQRKVLDEILFQCGQLQQKALIIKDQIQTSDKILEGMEEKVDRNQKNLRNLAARTEKAGDQQKCNSWYTYTACFLLLLALFGVVVYYMDLVPQT